MSHRYTKWFILFFFGVCLGLTPYAYSRTKEWSRERAILNIAVLDGLPDDATVAFKKFKQDLVFHFQGYTPVLASQDGLSIFDPPILTRAFPNHIFIKIKHDDNHNYEWMAAMSLDGGPNWFFQSTANKREVVSFLAFTGQKLTTMKDAQEICDIVNLLSHDSFFTTTHERIDEYNWHLAIDEDENGRRYLEIGVDQDGNIESGFVTFE